MTCSVQNLKKVRLNLVAKSWQLITQVSYMCEKLPFTHTLRALQRLYLEMLVTLLLELIFRSFLSNAKFCLDHKSPSAELFELRQVLILIAELEVSRASPEASKSSSSGFPFPPAPCSQLFHMENVITFTRCMVEPELVGSSHNSVLKCMCFLTLYFLRFLKEYK